MAEQTITKDDPVVTLTAADVAALLVAIREAAREAARDAFMAAMQKPKR